MKEPSAADVASAATLPSEACSIRKVATYGLSLGTPCCSTGDTGPIRTSPWTPLFAEAAGLVLERGGMLSHGAIVARDFGIPAVVLPDATRLIADGASVKVDGGRGTVELLAEKS